MHTTDMKLVAYVLCVLINLLPTAVVQGKPEKVADQKETPPTAKKSFSITEASLNSAADESIHKHIYYYSLPNEIEDKSEVESDDPFDVILVRYPAARSPTAPIGGYPFLRNMPPLLYLLQPVHFGVPIPLLPSQPVDIPIPEVLLVNIPTQLTPPATTVYDGATKDWSGESPEEIFTWSDMATTEPQFELNDISWTGDNHDQNLSSAHQQIKNFIASYY